MEWALFIAPSGLEDAVAGLDAGGYPRPVVFRTAPAAGLERWDHTDTAMAHGGGDFSRVYWGCEFCETLVPGARATARLAEALGRQGLAWSLVTPYATDRGLDRVARLMGALPRELMPDEVVINDWGMLRWFHREHPGIRPVMGRLMNKMIRDPRVATKFDDPRSPESAKRAIKGWSISAGSYREFLRDKGVVRVEIDSPLQGLAVDFAEEGMAASIYLPFGYVTTGRICLPGSLALDAGDKFSHLSACGRECSETVLELKNTRSPIKADRGLSLYQRGNTIFYVLPPDRVADGLDTAADRGVDRVVWQPSLPF
jgi:hypothetical protein